MTSEQRKEFDCVRRAAQTWTLVLIGPAGVNAAKTIKQVPAPRATEIVRAMIQQRIEELQRIAGDFDAKMERIDAAEADSRFHCDVDDCDQPHCRECGRHYDGIGATCAGCEVERARDEMAAVSAAFGGNHEAAARFMGW